MSGRDWEVEDGMGFAGMVPTAAEKSQERYDERQRQQTAQLREAHAASELRNRELQARLDAAEKFIDDNLNEPNCECQRCEIMREFSAAISPTPTQPAAGEERT